MSPERGELPEALVEATAKALAEADVGEPGWADMAAEERDVYRYPADKALQAALDTGHLLLVPEGEVGLSLSREELEQSEADLAGRTSAHPMGDRVALRASIQSKLRTALEVPEHPGGEEDLG